MVAAPTPIRDAQKLRMQWLARGLASHATRIYAGSLGRAQCVAICGYPRSGTSWISAVLGQYYALPVPRHYARPQFYPQVLHGHDLRLGSIRRVFYVMRSPFDLFPSLFVKRYGINTPSEEARGQFTAFLRAELQTPFESPLCWADHVALACRKYGPASVLTYTCDPDQMAQQLTLRIRTLDGYCNTDRLLYLTAQRSTGPNAPTTVTSAAARRFDWFTPEAHRLIQAELSRLHRLCPDLDHGALGKEEVKG